MKYIDKMVHIVDYGAGNIGSVQNMLKRLETSSVLCSNPQDLKEATKIILPGVGHFGHAMNKLKSNGFIEILNKKVVEDKIPILGICLGAQLMCRHSEEGDVEGLGWFEADVRKFKFEDNSLRVPHMGWNFVNQVKQSRISDSSKIDKKFYFVHSYHMTTSKRDEILFETNYGYNFASALEYENKFACQFHPEKSHKYGMEIFKNFIAL